MKLGINFVTGFDRNISSWKSVEDPATGLYSFRIEPQGLPQLVLKKGPEVLFNTGSWNGVYFTRRSLPKDYTVYSYEFVLNKDEVYYKFGPQNKSIFSRYLLNPSGLVQRSIWNDGKNDWEIFSSTQSDQCYIYAYCGPYSSCSIDKSPSCKCLEGFMGRLASLGDLVSVDWSKGCTRRTPLACDGRDSFLKQTRLKIPDTSKSWSDISINLKGCEELCLKNCSCTAYANLDIREGGRGCRCGEQGKEDLELPIFDFATISTATNNFSSDNKLGQGGLGPVYRGTFIDGQEITVKRLSKNSGQGIEEFKNEVTLIAKLQHRNLRGYLHHDSRLRIIHRDLKASNILLDNDMNPKISDFGLARKFGVDQIQAKTKRVVGTYGYMSPQYALDGLFSMKSDVFSFGVLVLEILSGKKNRGFSHPDHDHNLLGHAHDLWSVVQVDTDPPPLRANPTIAQIRQYNEDCAK
ncbi:hypothetical protein Gotri_024034, partial [Gossypium trilobum]|nr:hypothetical protein [Gossypium trilobum]